MWHSQPVVLHVVKSKDSIDLLGTPCKFIIAWTYHYFNENHNVPIINLKYTIYVLYYIGTECRLKSAFGEIYK